MFKNLLLLISLFITATQSLYLKDSEYRTQFSDYIREYNKVYSDHELVSRFSIFIENVQKINQHNSEGHSWTAGINQFTDLTPEEFKMTYAGCYRSSSESFDNVIPRFAFEDVNDDINTADLPDSWDWRSNGAVTPVKNQASCGSCWSFSTTGSIEGAYFLSRGKLVSLSEQMLVDCSSKNSGCNGGDMGLAEQFVQQNGICSEADYPYTAQDGHCRSNKCKIVTKIDSYVNVTPNDESALQQAVYLQPVSIAACAENWQYYFGGIMDSGECYDLDHGILLVAWGNENGTPYWVIKNSWGASWGEQGYLRVKRNVQDKRGSYGLAMEPSYAVINKKFY